MKKYRKWLVLAGMYNFNFSASYLSPEAMLIVIRKNPYNKHFWNTVVKPSLKKDGFIFNRYFRGWEYLLYNKNLTKRIFPIKT